jgi:hypothetical protein
VRFKLAPIPRILLKKEEGRRAVWPGSLHVAEGHANESLSGSATGASRRSHALPKRGGVPGWFADRHPNPAGYHVIGDEAAHFLAPLIRKRLKEAPKP